MWVIAESGEAVNLTQAQTLEVMTDGDKIVVEANLPESYVTLKSFDTPEEARNFIYHVVGHINGGTIGYVDAKQFELANKKAGENHE